MRDLMIYVKEIRGSCDIMKVGYYCIVRGSRLSIPESPHFCFYALQSILPLIPAKQRRIEEPEDWLPRTWEVECPDPKGQVILCIKPIEPHEGHKIKPQGA
ncbi:MAG: TIGR04076 family protein [Candidatus Bathyarchaeia archaeon]|nr:TIGR04076 family protein [Candidatus Bathyarchaeota archaeon]